MDTTRLRSVCLAASMVSLAGGRALAAEVDVYFVTGQSNAGNFVEVSGTGPTDVGFDLHFGRTYDRFEGTYPDSTVVNPFTSNTLDLSLATPILATQLHEDGSDVGIFGFARNGAPLAQDLAVRSWYPGDDPAAGQYYNGSLYANFVSWANARLTDLVTAGHTPVVRGIFWYQGETDGSRGDHNEYQANFENLVFRFREDFGENLPIVVTELREVTNTAANRAAINATLRDLAANDDLIGYVSTSGLPYRSAGDVHLSDAGLAGLAPRWGAEMQALFANIPDPGPMGDLNDDGFVGVEDLEVLLAAWGDVATGGGVLAGDLDGDGSVGQGDLTIVIDHWGTGTPPAVQVPEPGSLGLLGVAGLMLLRRRR